MGITSPKKELQIINNNNTGSTPSAYSLHPASKYLPSFELAHFSPHDKSSQDSGYPPGIFARVLKIQGRDGVEGPFVLEGVAN